MNDEPKKQVVVDMAGAVETLAANPELGDRMMNIMAPHLATMELCEQRLAVWQLRDAVEELLNDVGGVFSKTAVQSALSALHDTGGIGSLTAKTLSDLERNSDIDASDRKSMPEWKANPALLPQGDPLRAMLESRQNQSYKRDSRCER